MSFQNLPWELKGYQNWVCWRYESRGEGKPTKVPYNPLTGYRASSTDPSHWVSFDAAIGASGYDGIGFVFTNSPFAGIDLDPTTDLSLRNWHESIVQAMGSYAERSPSGNGLHIIVRGSVAHGKKDTSKACEIYSENRFFTMTGDVYLNLPVVDRSVEIVKLWNELGGNTPELSHVESGPVSRSDDEIVAMAARAANNEKFRALWNGDISEWGNDHSAADLALCNILAFYTPNHDQCGRLFRASALGRREKADRPGYIASTVRRAYDGRGNFQTDTSPVAALQARMAVSAPVAVAEEPEEDFDLSDLIDESVVGFELAPDNSIPWPPGVAGQLAAEFYEMSMYPRRRVCIAAALNLLSMICGRSWHVGTLGLNLYSILLGKTGLGKTEGISTITRAAQQVDRASTSVNQSAQLVQKLRKEIVSKQGMHRDLAEHKSIIWIIDEFHRRMASMLKAPVGTAEWSVKSFITETYTESSLSGYLSAVTHAKKENSMGSIERPNMVLFGLGVPEQFWNSLNNEQLEDGFLNRFILFECPDNEDSSRNLDLRTELSPALLGRMVDLVHASLSPQSIPVQLSERVREADYQASEYYRLKGSDRAKFAQARTGVNSLKVGALLAVADTPWSPVISYDSYVWAHSLASEGAKRVIQKFDLGETGSGDVKCIADLRRIIKSFFDPKSKWQKSVATRTEGTIPFRHLRQYAFGYSSFIHHQKGASLALTIALKTLSSEGVIREVPGRRGGSSYELLVPWKRI